MTMIRPKIKGLKMTKPKKQAKEGDPIGKKGHGNMKGEFLGTSKMLR